METTLTLDRFDSTGIQISASGGLAIYSGIYENGRYSGTLKLQGRAAGRFIALAIAGPPLPQTDTFPRALHICASEQEGGPPNCADWTWITDHFARDENTRLRIEKLDGDSIVAKALDINRGVLMTFTGKLAGIDVNGSVTTWFAGGKKEVHPLTATLTLPPPPAPNPLDTPALLARRKAILGDSGERVTYEVPQLALYTQFRAINDKGEELGSAGFGSSLIYHAHNPFVYQGGKMTPLIGPVIERQHNEQGPIATTTPVAINNHGEALLFQGSKNIANDRGEYFIVNIQSGEFRQVGRRGTVNINGRQETLDITEIEGMNDAGEIVGSSTKGSVFGTPVLGESNAFAAPANSGHFTSLPACPGPGNMHTTGINNRKQIVGYCGEMPALSFIYSDGAYTPLHYDGAASMEVHAISNSGLVAGDFLPKHGAGIITSVGFVFDGSRFTVVVLPGARDRMSGVFTSNVLGINSQGEMVGTSSDPSGTERSFVAKLKR